MSKPSFHIAIVGCGIAGMNAAIALLLKGHKVTLLDTRSNPAGTFANGISLGPNASRILDKFGLLELLRAGSSLDGSEAGPDIPRNIRRFDDNRSLMRRVGADYRQYYGYPVSAGLWGPCKTVADSRKLFSTLRQMYVPIMLNKVRGLGANVRLGIIIDSIDEFGPAVILQGGERFEADIVIGADGETNCLNRRQSAHHNRN